MNRGDWMITYTGKAFYPLHPDPSDLDHRDIAHALSLICRYGGHVRRFYSVAEHCVHLSYAVPAEDALWALLHDATEAYLGDMIRPLKRNMPDYEHAEYVLMAIICDRYGLARQFPASVKDADNRILLDERAALLPPSPQPWASALEAMDPLGVNIRAWGPAEAEHRYLQRFAELAPLAVIS